jgi:hypothetical protein
MYESIYACMVEARVAIQLDEEVILDENGNQVETKEAMF